MTSRKKQKHSHELSKFSTPEPTNFSSWIEYKQEYITNSNFIQRQDDYNTDMGCLQSVIRVSDKKHSTEDSID